MVRVPGWAPAQSVRLTVDGTPADLCMIGSYACISREALRAGSEIVLLHDLPERRTRETMPAGDTYEFAWRGDEIIGVSPNEHPLPFYPTLKIAEKQ